MSSRGAISRGGSLEPELLLPRLRNRDDLRTADAEALPVGVGRDPDAPGEGADQSRDAAEAGPLGHARQGSVRRLEVELGAVQPHALDVAGGGHARLLGKDSPEVPLAHRRPVRQRGQRQVGLRIVRDPEQKVAEPPAAFRLSGEAGTILGLAARSPQEQDQVARQGLSFSGPSSIATAKTSARPDSFSTP